MNRQEKYWDKKITAWTKASYRGKEKKGIGLVEAMAQCFRSGIEGRMKVALDVVGPMAQGKIIADMGCGLGDFCFEIVKFKPRKVIGIDISSVAVKQAQKMAEKKKLARVVSFRQGNLAIMKRWPKFDIAVGLGFIDYFKPEEMKTFFSRFKHQYFFFSFFEKRLSLLNLIHPFYVKLQGCPGSYKYTRGQIRRLIPEKVKFDFFEKNGLLFVTNLPL